MNLAAKKLGFPKNAPEKPCVCSNARDGVFIERPAQSRNGLFPAVAPGDEFAQQRVVIVGYGPAFVDALVKADSRAAWNLPGENFSRQVPSGPGIGIDEGVYEEIGRAHV